MPLTWKIDTEQKLVTMVAAGDIGRADFEALHVALRAADAHGHRKLFDGLLARMRLTAEDVLRLGALVRGQHAEGPVAALAVALTEADTHLLAPLLGMLAVADRPMRIFDNVVSARRWIGTQSGV